jgi:hypothetical protein
MIHEFSPTKNRDFRIKSLLVTYPLERAADYIEANFAPEDIFETEKLAAWAEKNGYTKKKGGLNDRRPG